MAEGPSVFYMRIAVGHVVTLAKVFAFAAIFGVAVVAARAFGVNHVGSLGIQTPLSSVWVVFFAVTMIHYYLSIAATASFSEYLDSEHNISRNEVLTGEELYQEIRSQNTVFLRGLLARTPLPGGRLYRMSWRDPTTLVFIGLCLLDYIALLPWRNVNGRLEWMTGTGYVVALFTMGILLLALNWAAASDWTIALSQLRLPEEQWKGLTRFTNYSTPQGNEIGCIVAIIFAVLALTAIPWLIVTFL